MNLHGTISLIMPNTENPVRLSPNEQAVVDIQTQVLAGLDNRGVIWQTAAAIVAGYRINIGEDATAFLRKRRKVPTAHFVDWEERVESGEVFGSKGKINFTPDGEKIICHLCGGEFDTLSGTHLNAHGLEDGDAYRELLGLNRNQPLAAPRYSERKRDTALRINSAKYFFDTGHRFQQGYDQRRTKPKRPQFVIEHRQISDNKREKGEIPPSRSGLPPNFRALNYAGRFNLYGKSYFFSKKATGPVEILNITDKEITIRGTLKDGSIRERSYKRRR